MSVEPRRGLRQAMSDLHTWTGLLAGWLLFAVFVTGTLSFYRQEITVWMQPEIHAARPDRHGLERALAYLEAHATGAKRWSIALPGPRSPLLDLGWGSGLRPKDGNHVLMDPATGRIIEARQTAGGKFLFDFHYRLHAVAPAVGEWIVGIAAMFMFVALVSGVIVHRHIFKDFFTFRPGKGKRSWLDAHNASGVLALPFYLAITFSGLLLLGPELLPAVNRAAYGNAAHGLLADLHRGKPDIPLAHGHGEQAALTALAPLLAAAERHWPNNGVAVITVVNPGTAQAIVELRETAGERLGNRGMPERLLFDGVDGTALATPVPETSAVRTVFNVLQALHIGYFALPLARCLLFVSGLLGCFVIASGLVIWSVSRQATRSGRGARGQRLVEVLNVAAVAGLLVALAAFFWANRLLPATLPERASAEIEVFFAVWAAALAHAALRRHRRAWVEQLGAAGLLGALLPALNALSGGLPLPASLYSGQPQVGGFDLCALLLGGLLLFAAGRIRAYRPSRRAGERLVSVARHTMEDRP